MGAQAFEGVGRSQVFMLDADDDVIIIGLDTNDGPEHVLYDERIYLTLDYDLVENILLLGKVLEPVSVRKNGDKAEVVFGRQRARAVREANKRLKESGATPEQLIKLPCQLDKSNDLQLLLRMMSENAQRRGDTPMARARNIQRCLDLGASEKDLTKVFKLSVQHLKAQTALLNLDKVVQKMVDDGSLPATAAANLAGLSRDEQKVEAEKLISQGRTTVADAKHAAKRAKVQKRGGNADDVVKAPSKRELRRVLEANASLDEDDQLSADFIKGIRVALGDLSPASIKGLTAMMAGPAE